MNNYLKHKIAFLGLVLSVFFTSCISNVEEQLIDEGGIDFTVSFKDNVKPIIDGRCLSCHSSGGNFPELTSYAKVSTNAMIVRNEVSSGRMPQGGALTAAQVKSIVDWVDEGALDN